MPLPPKLLLIAAVALASALPAAAQQETPAATAPAPAPTVNATADTAEGERLYRARCASCHGATPEQARIGPSLGGVVGRTAASVEGARYSQALRDAGITWDAATLDAYLANPRQLVRGTTMTVSVRDADDRAAIVAYLGTLQPAN